MILLLSPRLIASLSDAWATFKTGTLWKAYAKANPLESARVDSYYRTGTPYPATKTATGTALTQLVALYRGDLNG